MEDKYGFMGSPDDYFNKRAEEMKFNRIAILKAELTNAARQLEYWRQAEDRLYRQLAELEGMQTEQEWL